MTDHKPPLSNEQIEAFAARQLFSLRSARAMVVEIARAAIAASAPPAAMQEEIAAEPVLTEWQPIDSAPKDGTTVIVAQGQKVARAWYVVTPFRETRDRDGCYIDQTDHDEFWMGDDGDVYEPTLWQPEAPLPAPPDAIQPAEGDQS